MTSVVSALEHLTKSMGSMHLYIHGGFMRTALEEVVVDASGQERVRPLCHLEIVALCN